MTTVRVVGFKSKAAARCRATMEVLLVRAELLKFPLAFFLRRAQMTSTLFLPF